MITRQYPGDMTEKGHIISFYLLWLGTHHRIESGPLGMWLRPLYLLAILHPWMFSNDWAPHCMCVLWYVRYIPYRILCTLYSVWYKEYTFFSDPVKTLNQSAQIEPDTGHSRVHNRRLKQNFRIYLRSDEWGPWLCIIASLHEIIISHQDLYCTPSKGVQSYNVHLTRRWNGFHALFQPSGLPIVVGPCLELMKGQGWVTTYRSVQNRFCVRK